MALKELHENRLTCDVHVIVQGDHGVAPLVWVREIWELMPLLCREKQTVYLVFLSVAGQKTIGEAIIKARRGGGELDIPAFFKYHFDTAMSLSLCCVTVQPIKMQSHLIKMCVTTVHVRNKA